MNFIGAGDLVRKPKDFGNSTENGQPTFLANAAICGKIVRNRRALIASTEEEDIFASHTLYVADGFTVVLGDLVDDFQVVADFGNNKFGLM